MTPSSFQGAIRRALPCVCQASADSVSTHGTESLEATENAIPANILKLAGSIEADLSGVMAWFAEDPIFSLGGRTAKDLVADGKDKAVVNFLRKIERDEAWHSPASERTARMSPLLANALDTFQVKPGSASLRLVNVQPETKP